jgi:hypothetical protein
MQEYTYYVQQFVPHSLYYHSFLHPGLSDYFPMVSARFPVVYHEHRFDNQHQAKINFLNLILTKKTLLFTNCEIGIIFLRIRSAFVLSSRLSITAKSSFDALSYNHQMSILKQSFEFTFNSSTRS